MATRELMNKEHNREFASHEGNYREKNLVVCAHEHCERPVSALRRCRVRSSEVITVPTGKLPTGGHLTWAPKTGNSPLTHSRGTFLIIASRAKATTGTESA